MTNTTDPCDTLDAVRDIAKAAGRCILDIYEREFKVEKKADASPLTEADRMAHVMIVERLLQLTPEIPVLSEESAAVAYEKRAAWRRFWLVDPLDGTKEFITHNGEFTVNIALIDGDRPVLGVVYVPITGVSYFACQGQDAFKQKGECALQTIRARRYDGGRAIVTASRSHASDMQSTFLKNLGDHDIVNMGSALKFGLVAEGTADVYPRLGPTMEWDTAAAQCVVEAAGGRVLDSQRQPLTYNKRSLRNPWFVATGAGTYDWLRHLPASGK